MGLGDLHLATLTEVANSRGSHQWVSPCQRFDEEEGIGVTSEHLPRNSGQLWGR